MQDFLQRFSCPAVIALAPHPFQTFCQRPLYRFRDGLTGLFGDQASESLGLFVPDTKGHNPSCIELYKLVYTTSILVEEFRLMRVPAFTWQPAQPPPAPDAR